MTAQTWEPGPEEDQKATVDAWREGVHYMPGDLAEDHGTTYKALMEHTSESA